MAVESSWLIKSGGRILGPYVKAQVVDLLKTREINVFDEVAEPTRRWQSLRHHPAFHRAVEELRLSSRDRGPFSEDTATNLTGSMTGSVTEPLEFFTADDLTDKIKSSLKEIVYEDVEEKPIEAGPKQTAQFGYGLGNSQVVRRETKRTMRSLWVLTFLIIGCVSAYVAYTHFINRPKENVRMASDDRAEAALAMEVGDYQRALEILNKLYGANPNDRSIHPLLGTLMVQMQGQTVVGRRLLKESLSEKAERGPQVLTAMGVASLMDGDLNSAKEAFDGALKQNPEYLPALANMGSLHMQKRNYVRAKAYFESALGFDDGAVILLITDALIYLSQAEKDPGYLNLAKVYLRDQIRTRYDYKQETLLFLAYVEWLLGESHAAEETVRAMWNVDPDLTEDHRHDLFLYRMQVGWPRLMKYCDQLKEGLKASPAISALAAYCLLKSDQQLEAKKAIEDAVAQEPKDPTIQGLYAYILQTMGLEQQFSVILGRSVELNRGQEAKLPLLLQARFCSRQGDTTCEEQNWNKLLQIDETELSAIAGLGFLNLARGGSTRVQELLAKGLALSPNYKPFLRLAKKAETFGVKVGR